MRSRSRQRQRAPLGGRRCALRSIGKWAAALALIVGGSAAVAFGDDAPLAPKNLTIVSFDEGAGLSRDGSSWTPLAAGIDRTGLTLNQATYVRGPARIRVLAGSFVDVPAGSVVLVSWEPAIRGWKFEAITGDSSAVFATRATWLYQGRSITLSSGGDLFRGPGAYGSRNTGLDGLPEVSPFRTSVFDLR